MDAKKKNINKSAVFHLNSSTNRRSSNMFETKEDLFYDLRHFLRFGKLIGLLPISGMFGSNSSGLSHKYEINIFFILPTSLKF